MSTDPDDLDKLLADVRKSIDENRLFLKALAGDAADEFSEEDSKEPETFEEL